MLPDHLPALPSVRGPILDVIGDRRSALPPGAEASNSSIPYDFAGAKRPHLAQSDPLLLARHRGALVWLLATA